MLTGVFGEPTYRTIFSEKLVVMGEFLGSSPFSIKELGDLLIVEHCQNLKVFKNLFINQVLFILAQCNLLIKMLIHECQDIAEIWFQSLKISSQLVI